jgi:hypothetical protein
MDGPFNFFRKYYFSPAFIPIFVPRLEGRSPNQHQISSLLANPQKINQKENAVSTIFISVVVSSHSVSNITVFQTVKTFDFAVGIFPLGTLGYDLDQSTDTFKAFFNGSYEFLI